jgi:GT2 family glycosyltransferase
VGKDSENIKMDLSIIIVSFNTKKLLTACLKSILDYTKGINFEIIVVDNDSEDGSAEAAKNLGVRVIRNNTNPGFATANNQGSKISGGKYVLFLNSDTEIHDNVLGEIVRWMDITPKAGIATCGLKNKDGSLQATGGYFPTLPRVFSWMTIQDLPFVDNIIKPFHPLHSKSLFFKGDNFYKTKKELDWVTGAFLLTRHEILEKAGGWDESFFMYVEEVDLCFRVKKLGYEVWYLPGWSITHLGGASSSNREFALVSEYQGLKKFYKKHFSAWQHPILRILLKIGALGRMVLFGILEGSKSVKIYAKVFRSV